MVERKGDNKIKELLLVRYRNSLTGQHDGDLFNNSLNYDYCLICNYSKHWHGDSHKKDVDVHVRDEHPLDVLIKQIKVFV